MSDDGTTQIIYSIKRKFFKPFFQLGTKYQLQLLTKYIHNYTILKKKKKGEFY